MKFKLNDYKAMLSDEEILQDIQDTARKLDVEYLSISMYKANGKFSQTAIQGHFGTWKNALSEAGLRNERNSSEHKRITDEEYYEDLRRVAKLIQSNTVPYNEYRMYGKYSSEYICTRFKRWNDVLEKAGLEKTGFSKDKITELQCYEEIERMWISLGRQPTSTDIIKHGYSRYSLDTYKRRFGGWRNALQSFVQFINENDISEDTPHPVNNSCDDVCEHYSTTQIDRDTLLTTKKSHRTSRNVNLRLRFKVMERDCFKCCACGASPVKGSPIKLEVDHIIPWSKGGETTIDNLQTLCSKCNSGKSNL